MGGHVAVYHWRQSQCKVMHHTQSGITRITAHPAVAADFQNSNVVIDCPMKDHPRLIEAGTVVGCQFATSHDMQHSFRMPGTQVSYRINQMFQVAFFAEAPDENYSLLRTRFLHVGCIG
ncbi:hypothetical protein B382_21141 [Stutzerimonas stutzeri B1SMN1]|nr:hypothetical protein B382_21141 [Stutzerimonas stutzeri B1SMN1]